MAGYSKTPLVQKLGIKAGHKVYLGNPPKNYHRTLAPLPENSVVLTSLKGPLDFIQFFSKVAAEVDREFPKLKRALAKDGMIWISWPKAASKVETDLSENIVREIGLKNKLVDVKICAVDEVWSGLKFVYRLKDR